MTSHTAITNLNFSTEFPKVVGFQKVLLFIKVQLLQLKTENSHVSAAKYADNAKYQGECQT